MQRPVLKYHRDFTLIATPRVSHFFPFVGGFATFGASKIPHARRGACLRNRFRAFSMSAGVTFSDTGGDGVAARAGLFRRVGTEHKLRNWE